MNINYICGGVEACDYYNIASMLLCHAYILKEVDSDYDFDRGDWRKVGKALEDGKVLIIRVGVIEKRFNRHDVHRILMSLGDEFWYGRTRDAAEKFWEALR